jgi:hypothetical protein
MLKMLKTSCIRELELFWQNLYVQHGDFLCKNFIQSKVFILHLVTKHFESIHQHVTYIMKHEETCS